MNIFPAIDIVRGCAVRLYKGDYDQMTVYSENPEEIAADFESCGAKFLHLVDLEGAKDGTTPNIETVKKIREACSLYIEIGGGIRNIETVKTYLNAGVDRVILGTAAVNDEEFLKAAVKKYGEKIAVGVDIKDGFVAIKGWTEKSEYDGFEFCEKMQKLGVKTIICTDISKDGAMVGTNRELYRQLSEKLNINITASGGISTIDDVKALADMNLYGAIIGKAYYTGAINLREALEVAE
ncbi:MAG: 1-(5-phosphoribosyl)-5-[(5-phosphoribosylamino)methylideneamino]imidazole-4-carboxamide isomerase [Ruminococcaceae bacterium]|nr:1-(5-phosphoribosyl)-5-[(5-phosphoribosylamino)methylideneamino]imidazole-4-carboxamide isomerase [Oscillospiraceae bacterium]